MNIGGRDGGAHQGFKASTVLIFSIFLVGVWEVCVCGGGGGK